MARDVTPNNKFDQFVKEYELLCKKHEFFIGGCGCCDSPSVDDGGKSYASLKEHMIHIRKDHWGARDEE